MTTTLIHFGLAKTATTYLQKTVFPQARGVNYLGKPFRSPAKALMHAITHRHALAPLDRFLKDEPALRSDARGDFAQLTRQVRRALSRDALNIWSHEGFLRPTRDSAPFRRSVALANLRRVFEAAGSEQVHALLILRETRPLMASYARQFLHELTAREPEDAPPGALYALRDAAGRNEDATARLWDLWYSYFDFAALMADLETAFGPGHVHVLNYDQLAQDWAALRATVRAVHHEAWLDFPDVRVNDSREKTAQISAPLQRHLEMLDALDLERLYPGNTQQLKRAAQ